MLGVLPVCDRRLTGVVPACHRGLTGVWRCAAGIAGAAGTHCRMDFFDHATGSPLTLHLVRRSGSDTRLSPGEPPSKSKSDTRLGAGQARPEPESAARPPPAVVTVDACAADRTRLRTRSSGRDSGPPGALTGDGIPLPPCGSARLPVVHWHAAAAAAAVLWTVKVAALLWLFWYLCGLTSRSRTEGSAAAAASGDGGDGGAWGRRLERVRLGLRVLREISSGEAD